MEDNKKLINLYHCSNCNISFFSTTDIKECICCDRLDITSQEQVLDKEIKIIPYNKTLSDAVKNYKKKVLFNPLVPFVFKKKNVVNSIKQVYVPIFLVNVNCSGNISFLASDDKNDKSKVYDLLYDVNYDYKDIILNTSTKLDEDIFTSICDYNYNNVITMGDDKSKFLLSDIDPSLLGSKTKEKVSKYSVNIVRENVPHQLKKIKKDDTNMNFFDSKELYVPIYLLNVEYKNKNYQYIMNGENAKSKIVLPIGKFELVLFSLLVFSLVLLLSFLICYFL